MAKLKIVPVSKLKKGQIYFDCLPEHGGTKHKYLRKEIDKRINIEHHFFQPMGETLYIQEEDGTVCFSGNKGEIDGFYEQIIEE